jgi:hypothetical protein
MLSCPAGVYRTALTARGLRQLAAFLLSAANANGTTSTVTGGGRHGFHVRECMYLQAIAWCVNLFLRLFVVDLFVPDYTWSKDQKTTCNLVVVELSDTQNTPSIYE